MREQSIESLRRVFEVEPALAKDPTNKALRRELEELKPYYEFLKQDSERITRHEMLREFRRALEKKPLEPDTEIPGSEHGE
jgi:hypothetical protein